LPFSYCLGGTCTGGGGATKSFSFTSDDKFVLLTGLSLGLGLRCTLGLGQVLGFSLGLGVGLRVDFGLGLGDEVGLGLRFGFRFGLGVMKTVRLPALPMIGGGVASREAMREIRKDHVSVRGDEEKKEEC
jgi:hypothetical protein